MGTACLSFLSPCCAALPAPTPGQVTKEEYAAKGAPALGSALLQQLRSQGANPYYIPVGGSSALGVWGYLQAIEEVRQQSQELSLTFDVIASVRYLICWRSRVGCVCCVDRQSGLQRLFMCRSCYSRRCCLQSCPHCCLQPVRGTATRA